MSILREDALAYHSEGRPGKIQVTATKPFKDQRDLSLAYTPGVAEPCLEIARDPEEIFRYTARGNLVGVVSNGTAVLGLGNIGPMAAKPVMEGKGILFKSLADIDVFDLEVGSTDPEDVIKFCQLLEPTVGGINLEDIKAPDCFEIEERLKRDLAIPVFHDDQHGTAIISGAALLNAAELTNKKLKNICVVFSGAGAAAIATANHFVQLGVERENIIMVDSKGVIRKDRPDLDKYKAQFATAAKPHTLEEAFRGADVFVGLSRAGIVTREMVKAMAKRPIILALANPDPEISPEDARAARKDAIIATGRSDCPNQVNNVLGFPFIFRGALDVRARSINDEMKMAATRALADLTREPVPESVTRAYGLDRLEFGPEYIIPKPFDPRVLLWVSPAVARAAIDTNQARVTIDEKEYAARLEIQLGPVHAQMRGLSMRATRRPQRTVFPEGEDPRIVRAARILVDENTAIPILIGRERKVREAAEQAGITLEGVRIITPTESPHLETYARTLWKKRQRKGVTLSEARNRVREPIYYACLMLEGGDADALVAGEETYYPDTIRPALEVIGTGPNTKAVCSIYMMMTASGTYFFADCTVNIEPDAFGLADIASQTADFVWHLGIEPRVAMLSFSNFGSARHPLSRKVADAVRILHDRSPNLMVDGELQADTAVVDELLRERYPFSRLRSAANVLIFPDLNSANIGYKLLVRLGGAQAIGPILVGMAKPVHLLQRDSNVSDIVNIAVIAGVDAQEHAR